MSRDLAIRAARTVAVAVGVAVALLAASCAGSDSGPETGAGAGEIAVGADSFCEAWPEISPFMGNPEGVDQEGLTAYLDARDAAAAQVPDELTEQWASIVAWDDRMVEILYAIDFDWEALTPEIVSTAFGTEEAVEASERAQEAAVAQIDRWAVGNCGDGAADTLSFCGTWTDIFLALEGIHPDPNMDPESEDARNRLTDLIAQGDAVAPAEVLQRWDPIADYHLTWHDVLLAVNFDESLISDDLLTDAFGSPEAAAAAATAAESSVTDVEAWAATGCGDFCARSRELTETMGELGGPLDERVVDAYGFALRTRSLAHAEALMPDELRVYWEPVSAELADWMGWWESHDYDRRQLETPEAQAEAIEIYRQAEYLPFEAGDRPEEAERRAAIAAWRAGEAELTGEAADLVNRTATAVLWERDSFLSAFFEIDRWAEGNCTNEAGGPGLVEVRFGEVTGAAGDNLVLLMGPAGSTIADLATPERFSNGWCQAIDRDPWGVNFNGDPDAPSQLEYWGMPLHSISDDGSGRPLCEGQGDNAVVDPGDYTLVAARYDGATPQPGLDVRPTHCLALDVTVSGDTIVDLGELPECDVAEAPPAPGEWGYTETVSPSTPGAGTLKVRIRSQVSGAAREFEGGGRYLLQVMALPHGTTLNEVGREELFPPAAGCSWLWPERNFREELEMRPVEVPLGRLPNVGLRSCLDPDWLNGAAPISGGPAGEPADDTRLPLVVLAPGVYDVYVRGAWEDGADEGSCVNFEATVDGDTVVDLPVDVGDMERC